MGPSGQRAEWLVRYQRQSRLYQSRGGGGGSSGWSSAARVAGRSIGGHTRSSGRGGGLKSRRTVGCARRQSGAAVAAGRAQTPRDGRASRAPSHSGLGVASNVRRVARVRAVPVARWVVVGYVRGLGVRARGGGCRHGPSACAETRGEAIGPLPVHGEPLQLGWGHLVEELVEGGLRAGGRPRDEVLVPQGEGTQRAVAVACRGSCGGRGAGRESRRASRRSTRGPPAARGRHAARSGWRGSRARRRRLSEGPCSCSRQRGRTGSRCRSRGSSAGTCGAST
jgi:hypothetical protein